MQTIDEARSQVIDAADRLFYARGVQAVSMDDLRSEASVSLKRLYSMFPSKEALVLAVLGRRHELWTTGIEAAAATVTEPRDKLLSMYDYLFDWFRDDTYRGCGFINAFGELGATVPAVAEATRQQKESFQRYVAGLVADIGATPLLADQLAILAEGAQTTAAIAGRPDAALAARDAAAVLIDAALTASSPAPSPAPGADDR
ncbi:MAG TPA: TetR/AcrR family transcriptional regulator [Lacisediminihabitans sp.]|uniref:TetR/AcrR family transcriptional regulator n=1 Tax=Lacisediminihabitans sp. TaxID=2787631 RepID=UPI002ED8E448